MFETKSSPSQTDMKRQLADYAMALDLIGAMAGLNEESVVIEKISELFWMLCSPTSIVYLTMVSGNPGEILTFSHDLADREATKKSLTDLKEGYAWTESGNGFILKIGNAHETLGILKVDGFAFPEYRQHYLNLALNIVSVLAIAVLNARNYEDLLRTITDRKQAEDRLARQAMQLQERTGQLEKINQALESFSYSVSHDLRAPLRAIDVFSRTLVRELKDKIDEESKHRLDAIRNNALKMNQLIGDVLTFSRLGSESLTMTVIDMENLATDVWNELQEQNLHRNIEINIIHPMTCYGDDKMMRQVLTNLLSNAIKFTRERQTATIEVGSYEKEHECVYYVKDNGVGFDMRSADKLFNLFQRLHSKEEFEGTGVGLSFVKRIIERHRGRIWAEAKTNEGATFYFALPMREKIICND